MLLEPISKIRLVFRARRETVKKRSIHVVCEHFESFRNTAHGRLDCFRDRFMLQSAKIMMHKAGSIVRRAVTIPSI